MFRGHHHVLCLSIYFKNSVDQFGHLLIGSSIAKYSSLQTAISKTCFVFISAFVELQLAIDDFEVLSQYLT